MDDTLRLIQHLYDEDVDDPAFVQRLAEDEALRREYEQLLEAKEALDRRSSPSPDPDVVDDIVGRAADTASFSSPTSPADGRADRAARTPDRQRTRRLQSIGAVLVLLLVAVVGWWQMDAAQTSPASSATRSASVQQTESDAENEQGAEDDGDTAWENREDVVHLHQSIEMVRGQSDADAWEDMSQSVDRTDP